MKRNLTTWYGVLISVALMTGATQAYSFKDVSPFLAACIAHQYYTMRPPVVMFDVNGVLLDAAGKIIPEGAALLKKCALAGHTVMLFSNCSAGTIVEIYKDYHQEIGQYLTPQLIAIPEITKSAKPLASSYAYVQETIEKYKGKKPTIFFIDDTKIHVDTAQQHGIHGFHLQNNDYDSIERQLQALKVLP